MIAREFWNEGGLDWVEYVSSPSTATLRWSVFTSECFFSPVLGLGLVEIHAVPTMPGIAPSVISVSSTARRAEKLERGASQRPRVLLR